MAYRKEREMWQGPLYYCLKCNDQVHVKEDKGHLRCMNIVGEIPYCERFGEIKPDQMDIHIYCTSEDHSVKILRCGNYVA